MFDDLYIVESFVNADEGYRFGDSDPFAIRDSIFSDCETVAELRSAVYKYARREYGGCISKVYVDRGNRAVHTGYVFQRKERYEDTGEPYTREVWVCIEQRVGDKNLAFAFDDPDFYSGC